MSSSSLLGAVRLLRGEHGATPGARAAADVLEFMSRWPVAKMLFRPSDEHLDLADALTVLPVPAQAAQTRGLARAVDGAAPDRDRRHARDGRDRLPDQRRGRARAPQAELLRRRPRGAGEPRRSQHHRRHGASGAQSTRRRSLRPFQNVTHLLSDAQSEQNALLGNMAIAMVFRLPDEAEAEATCPACCELLPPRRTSG